MGQKFLHAAEVEVDSQNRISTGPLATEAKQDSILEAIAGAGLAAITGTGYTIKKRLLNAQITGATLIAAVPNKSLHIVGGIVTVGGADGTVTLNSAATPISAAYNTIVGGQINILPRPMSRPMWKTVAGEALTVTLGGAGQTVSVELEYIEV